MKTPDWARRTRTYDRAYLLVLSFIQPSTLFSIEVKSQPP